MKALAALATLGVALVTSALPALAARDSYVHDGASLFSTATAAQINAQVGDFAAQTGKEVVVVTVPSLGGVPIAKAAEDAFAQQRVNGVLIYLAKAEKQDLLLRDRASRTFFPTGELQNIHSAMRGYFRSGDFDAGITTGVNLTLGQYRSHLNALPRQHANAPVGARSSGAAQESGGFHMGFFWWIVIAIAAFLILRAIMRAMMAPKVYPPGYGQPGAPGYGQPGYGQPGYGGGMMGGGGGFWSGMLGGLGGAFLGNELFGNRGGGFMGGGDQAGMAGGGTNPDSSGWQNDAGQADTSDTGGGGWGGDGGGFDAGGGGGFDSGGGGGDSGW